MCEFTVSALLAGLRCPRCGSVRIERIDDAAYRRIPVENRLPLPEFLYPSTPVRCTACGLAGDRWNFLAD